MLRALLGAGLASIAGVVAITVWRLAVEAADAPPPVPEALGAVTFEGRALLAISDADMHAYAYADGRVRAAPDIEDTLSAWMLPAIFERGAPADATLAAPNSVITWPAVIDVSADGAFAYVVESRVSPTREQYDDLGIELPRGDRLSIFDLRALPELRLAAQVRIPLGARNVSVAPDGRFLVADSVEPGCPVARLPLDGGLPSGRASCLSLEAPAWCADDPRWAESVESHDGTMLAVQTCNRGVLFVALGGDGRASAIGEALPVDGWLTHGRFSRDGRYFFVADADWSASSLGAVLNRRGHLVSIAVDRGGAHRERSRVEVGLSPEGWALSPDERFAVTVDMGRTYLPDRFPYSLFGAREHGSLTLVEIDDGSLRKLDEVGLEGSLPENAEFDASGRALAVAVFHARDEAAREGWIELWRVAHQPTPHLERSAVRLPAVRGAHDLVRVEAAAPL